MTHYIHNNIIDEEIRDQEENYNKSFFAKIGLLNIDSEIDNSSNDISNIYDDQHEYMTIWLRNIDRLMQLVPKEYDLNNYSFYDVGCGTGKALIYLFFSYRFKKYFGLDFDAKLIGKGNNYLNYLNLEGEIELSNLDACNVFHNCDKCVYFMFNPFGELTMATFINNNIEHFKNNNCLILYANDILINKIHGFKRIIRDDYFNLSVILF